MCVCVCVQIVKSIISCMRGCVCQTVPRDFSRAKNKWSVCVATPTALCAPGRAVTTAAPVWTQRPLCIMENVCHPVPRIIIQILRRGNVQVGATGVTSVIRVVISSLFLTSFFPECDESCLTCAGPHMDACTSCRQHHRLDGLGRCVRPASACSPHQYAEQDGECRPCHKYCGGCWGPGTSHCLSCTQRLLLLSESRSDTQVIHKKICGAPGSRRCSFTLNVSADGTCVAECPAGYYGDESEQKCGACHRSCQSCVGASSHQCLICAARLFREGKQCVETCQPG